MSGTILVLNAGSSSLKFQAFDVPANETPRGQIDGIGGGQPRMVVKDQSGAMVYDVPVPPERAAELEGAQEVLGGWLIEHLGEAPMVVGHRVVHGGLDFIQPVLIDAEILAPGTVDPAGTVAPAQQPGTDPLHSRPAAGPAAGDMLRHELSSGLSGGGRPFRHLP